MSDFLSQFDKNSYQNKPAPPSAAPAKRTEPVVVVNDVREVLELKAVKAVKPVEFTVPEPTNDKAAIKGPVHQTEVDRTFQTKLIVRYAIIAAAVIAVCLTVFLIVRVSNQIDVTALVGKNLAEAQNWALSNRITLEVANEFNLDYDADIVFSQEPPDGKVQRGSIMHVMVSKGPDPNEIIPVPDFSSMDPAAIRQWISDNRATNARVVQEYSDVTETGGFLRIEFRDDMVNESHYARKDTLNIYISRGVEPVTKNITVPNFKTKTKEEVETWAQTNKIIVTFDEGDSDEIPKGNVIAQSIPANTKIAAEQEMTVTLSLGKGVAVPDFSTVPKPDALSAAPELNVEVTTQYSMSVPYGGLMSQSVPAGTKLYGEDKKVKVVYSEGAPYIEDLIGRAENLLPEYFYELRLKGVNISYSTAYVDSSLPKGTVVAASHSSQFIDMNVSVYIEISLGNIVATEPPFNNNYDNEPNSPPFNGNNGNNGNNDSDDDDGDNPPARFVG